MSAFNHEEELNAVLEKMEADSQDPMELMAAVFTALGNFIDVELVQASAVLVTRKKPRMRAFVVGAAMSVVWLLVSPGGTNSAKPTRFT